MLGEAAQEHVKEKSTSISLLRMTLLNRNKTAAMVGQLH